LKELEEAKKDKTPEGKKRARELEEQLRNKIYTPEEMEMLKIGKASAGFHYLGSAKIYCRIGEAFANAMVELDKNN